MDNPRRFLPERKNRGNRMSELAKDEGKMIEDDKYGIFKEDSSDDDFNPEDVKNVVNSSSADENEEGEEREDSNQDDDNESISEEISEKMKSPKRNKKEETILDIEQLDIDKIDMIEDLKDRGIDISDEEELEKRMKEYNEESEKDEEPKPVVIKKKRGRKSKKELEMMHKKRGRKKKVVEKDDNIFLSAQQPHTSEVININNKIIIDNAEINNNIELNEEENKNKSGKSSKIKKSKKEKLIKDLGIDPNLYFSNIHNTNMSIDENNFLITINKKCLTEGIPELNYTPQTNLDYIELNKYFESTMAGNKIIKKYKSKLEKNSKYNNSGIVQLNNSMIINKKNKHKNNDSFLNEEVNSNNDIIGHKRTRHENNLLEIFKKSKKDKPNKNVTIVGTRENPKYIYISKKIFDENDEEREIQKEEKKKKRREKEKEKDYEKENERINFDLEQEIDTKNIIMKYKQQERDKKQFGIQNKFISQEQRLLESIFTELTNKQSLKTMQKLEDLNKRENYLYTSRKAFKDFVKITNSERHIIEDRINNKNILETKKDNKNNNNEKKEEIKEEKINNNEIYNNINEEKKNDNKENQKTQENIENKEKIENQEENKENKENKEKKDNSKLIEEYKEKEKKLNKIRVTFNNKEYFRNLFNNLNKKPIKDKKEKLCVITGTPAKYFDPLTKNYYSTVEAFKTLRERYYQKEEDCLLFKIQTLSDLA